VRFFFRIVSKLGTLSRFDFVGSCENGELSQAPKQNQKNYKRRKPQNKKKKETPFQSYPPDVNEQQCVSKTVANTCQLQFLIRCFCLQILPV